MALVVQKYGGTSVGTPERILAVAERISKARSAGKSLVVVVSAMGHTTDELIELAHHVSDNPPNREMDMLLTAGERISMALLSMALADKRVPAVSFTGSQSGIITDASHRCARIKRILGDRVRSALSDGKVAIVAGFQGVSESKEITTLGRGGSDTTAVALAAALGAEECEIFTDVNGVYSADPRVVADARLLPRISHDLMVEMATRGAGVLHPRSIELAKQYGVRVRVLNSMSESEGTEVVNERAGPRGGMEEFRVTGVTADRGKLLAIVELARPTVLAALWNIAAEGHLAVIAPMFSDGKVHFFIDSDAESEWKKQIQKMAGQGFFKTAVFDSGMVPVSIVGDRFSQDGSALVEMMETLSTAGITVMTGTASALAVTVAVPRTHVDDAVRALHARFFSRQQG